MLQDHSLLNSEKPEGDGALFASRSKQSHDLVVVYNSGERRWGMQQYTQEQHEAFSATTSFPAGGPGQIVFIRGFISPSWVSAIGSKYNIDPEFFKRHMDFLSASIDRHSFSSPFLASSSKNMFRLCVSTLLHRDDFGGQDIQSQRSDQSIALGAYKIHQLGSSKVCCGDSMVREYSTVCPSFSIIEQWISLYIAKSDKGWAGKSLTPYTTRKAFADTRVQSLHGWIKVDPWNNLLRDHGRVTSNPRLHHYPSSNIIPRWHFEPPPIV